jgi:hypothetical protein
VQSAFDKGGRLNGRRPFVFFVVRRVSSWQPLRVAPQ